MGLIYSGQSWISRKFKSIEELVPFAPFHLIAHIEMNWSFAVKKKDMDTFPDCDDLGALKRFAFADALNDIYICSINANIPSIATIETNSISEIDSLISNFLDCLQINKNEVIIYKMEIEHLIVQNKENIQKKP